MRRHSFGICGNGVWLQQSAFTKASYPRELAELLIYLQNYTS